MVIALFIVGAISSILATSAYVELGLMNPVSGGDKVTYENKLTLRNTWNLHTPTLSN